MSHGTIERTRQQAALASDERMSRRTTLFAVAASLTVMGILAYDLLSGDWVRDAPLHLSMAGIIVLAVFPFARRAAGLHLGVLYVFGLFVYTVLRGFADDTGLPVRTFYVIDIDRALGFGTVPSQWLQRRFFDAGRLNPLDWFAVQVHWSYFLLPHLGALLVYARRRDLFARYVAAILGTFYVGLALYFILPTVPPWLAADNGALPGVARIMDYVGGRMDPSTYRRAYDAIGVPNPVAAMPSLHMGITFTLFLFSRQVSGRLATLLGVYSGLMAFSLVYLGEHYVADVLMGALVAILVHTAIKRWMSEGRSTYEPAPVRV